VAGISGADSERSSRGERTPLTFGRIVIVGGGCYGSWYAGQLARAAERGALVAREVVVVDRNPQCTVANRMRDGQYSSIALRLETTTWDAYLASWLAMGSSALANDALVPSPLMPQVLLDWLIARARSRWPDREVGVRPLQRAPDMPWERAAPDGRHYVSFATWTCPVNCIEPARCPATRGARDWSMPPSLIRYVEADAEANASGTPMRGPVIFHCVHRTYGVGMIDAAAIAAADESIAEWGASGPMAVLVGTVSHCHGALGLLDIT
jgi:hypothetical protein